MDCDAFYEQYQPKQADGETLFYLSQLPQVTAQHVWTVVATHEDDAPTALLAGYHLVNRLGYIVTDKPWVTGREYVDDFYFEGGAKEV